ncbi:RNA-binding domain-containing protein [Pluteus cervinus]|uniref:RNA-binding domain-containing protein n=1 Tax=Pluteus cervinus TaxID=181527 RepID=A0ACD3BIN1_9AGAR|nr:RNA-binding domain-containing protein [Pluteus cervinus]
MNRHHPYGGSFEGGGGGGPAGPMRRGGHQGPGPDRSHRYPDRGAPPGRGRGFGRGRGGGGGGYNNYESNMSNNYSLDQAPQDAAPYSINYDAHSANQDPYYTNSSGPPIQYQGAASGYGDQSYNKFEDGPGQNYGDEGGYSRGGSGPRRPIRKERDDKVHDSIIEERIQRERPCRTLFIRNIKYETSSDDVRRLFEEHGEIKTFFDLISTRGMVFVTYYDLRAAERARDRLQGSEISGRPIDVHYSLPRDDNARGNDRDKNQQLQGTVQVTLKNSSQAIDDGEVRRKFQQFGDVKSVMPVGDRNDSRYVEFYDVRACEEAHDRLRHQGLQDGVMDIVFSWDGNESNGPSAGSRSRTRRLGRWWIPRKQSRRSRTWARQGTRPRRRWWRWWRRRLRR